MEWSSFITSRWSGASCDGDVPGATSERCSTPGRELDKGSSGGLSWRAFSGEAAGSRLATKTIFYSLKGLRRNIPYPKQPWKPVKKGTFFCVPSD
jgi:hypothetical protein